MSSYDLAEVWVKFLEKFHESTSENVYNAWIKPLIPLEITDTYLKVGAKNNFTKNGLKKRILQSLKVCLPVLPAQTCSLKLKTLI